jgi:hypothetical protein
MTDQLCKLIELVANRTTVKFTVRFADGSSFISQRGETKVVVSFKTFAAEWKKGQAATTASALSET